MRRIKTSSKGGPGGIGSKSSSREDPTDLSSASEDELSAENKNGENGETGKDLSPYYCRHCYATSSKDWHHAAKEKILVCTDCRMYFKKYGELPCLEPKKELPPEEEEDADVVDDADIKKETAENGANAAAASTPAADAADAAVKIETKTEVDIKSEEQPQRLTLSNKLGNDLNLKAIEQDSNTPIISSASSALPVNLVSTSSSSTSGSDASSMFQHQPVNLAAAHSPPTSRPLFGLPPPPPPVAHSHMKPEMPSRNILGGLFTPVPPSSGGPNPMPGISGLPPPPPIGSYYGNKDSEIQILGHHHRSTPTPPPPFPKEPTPPPKPDGSEVHRSQSAIFTRTWNRGEGNSCSRTDMVFKPVPDSKLARKRDERLRRAASDEINSRMSLPPGFDLPHTDRGHFHPPPHSGAPPPGLPRISPHHPPPPPSHLHEMERRNESRNEELLRLSMNRLLPPSDHPFDPRRGFGPPPPPTSQAAQQHAAAAAARAAAAQADSRRLGEMAARANAERQYAGRMSALATDPLVRLQMAGVTPEIPGGPASSHLHLHPSYLLGPRGPPPPPPAGLEPPRFNPNDLLGLRYPPPPGMSHQELLQRQFMMEREFLAAHGAHQSMLAQQEEIFRLEQEAARARQQGRP